MRHILHTSFDQLKQFCRIEKKKRKKEKINENKQFYRLTISVEWI